MIRLFAAGRLAVLVLALVATGCASSDPGAIVAQPASAGRVPSAESTTADGSEPAFSGWWFDDASIGSTPPARSLISVDGAQRDSQSAPTRSRTPHGPAKALVTPLGLVVPVLSEGPAGYEVTAPCGEPATVSWGTPLYGAEIVLDPGHGGEVETGAVGPNGLAEKELNLRVAEGTAAELEHRGHVVVLTRTADYRVPLEVRAAIANQLGAKALVSIHHNAPTPQMSTTPGTEVFIRTGSAESRRLGGLIWQEMVDALSGFDGVSWAAATDAGALRVTNREGQDSYGMVRRPRMPAVLAELGYLSNPSEAELFATPEYVDVASVALADAIERWLDTDEVGGGLRAHARSFTPDGTTGHNRGCLSPPME